MSLSLPSKEIYAVDVPEIDGFEGTFQYNFFTPDESVSDSGGTPTKFLKRAAAERDSSFVQYATTRAPRLIVFNFKLPRLADPSGFVTDIRQRNNVFSTNSQSQNGSLIADNISKVISEDHFASNNFIAVSFHDNKIDDKVHSLISGSHALHMLGKDHEDNLGNYKKAHELSVRVPNHVVPSFLTRFLTQPSQAHGIRFFNKDGSRAFNEYFKQLKSVAINSQINGKLVAGVTTRAMKNPQSQFASDLHNLHKYAQKLQHQSSQQASLQITEDEFKTFVPFIDLKVRSTAHSQDYAGPEIVGYIIDKVELTPSGEPIHHPPIIIDNPRVSTTADFQIKYNTNYVYTIRTVALFNIPAIEDIASDGDIAMLKVLISSKPSTKVYVNTIETTAPPVPSDINFTWDYTRVNPTTAEYDRESGRQLPGTGRSGSLMIHWTFPPNVQRDIKKFQVFRRTDTNHPFELIKMYDFDNSVVRLSDVESVDSSLTEYLSSPKTFFYDDDFFVGDEDLHETQSFRKPSGGGRHAGTSTFIYSIVAIDAHGYTSGFSAQYEVWFDQFKNQLQKKLISHSGAPKPYPNLYLEADAFVDTIQVSGAHSKKMKVYFNPEYYHVYDNQERFTPVLATSQTGGSYKLQFINTDNQKSVSTTITINDQIRAASRTLAFPEVRFGAKRSSQTRKIISQ